MNILGPAILEDEFLSRVFDISKESVSVTPGLMYINMNHTRLSMKFIIDLDLDTGTLVKINGKRVKYSESHTFESVPGLCVLIKSVLEQLGLV